MGNQDQEGYLQGLLCEQERKESVGYPQTFVKMRKNFKRDENRTKLENDTG